MNITVRSDAAHAIACVTSMGVRITPEDRMAVQNSRRFMMQAKNQADIIELLSDADANQFTV